MAYNIKRNRIKGVWGSSQGNKRILWGLFVMLAIWMLTSKYFWRTFYPIPHLEIIKTEAAQQSIDPLLVAAVIRTESKFFSKATSRSGARGLMQIMPETGEWIAEQRGDGVFDKDDLFQPTTNIKYGSWYLANLGKEFNGDLILVIAAYNAGRGNVNKWLTEKKWTGEHTTLEQIPFPETREYVKRVLKNYEMYKQLYPEPEMK